MRTEAKKTERRRDLLGRVFGRLTVIERMAADRPVSGRHAQWLCRCECGCIKKVESTALVKGETVSCGCYGRERIGTASLTHGMTDTRTFRVWHGMLQRCRNCNDSRYYLYGGRGIKVCERWSEFANFYADMGDRPAGMSIERIDNDGDYAPTNCKWASALEQASNRRNTVFLTKSGETRPLADWARALGICRNTIYTRLSRGWSHEDALRRPSPCA